nr:ABC transporter permease [uncultured Dysosmobacter sp.]
MDRMGEDTMIQKLLRHRFLFEELVKRDFKKKYKRTVLGMGWSLLSPLLMLLVMKLVFTHFFGRNTPHYTIYLFCGNLVFTYFSESTKSGMRALMDNSKIFSKVTVPKYLFLLSKNVQTFISFLLTLVIFFIFVAFDHLPFTWKFLCLLYPICLLILFNIGVGMILSAMYIFFRDIQYLYDVFVRLLMYMSAIFYQIDSYGETARKLFLLNPVYLFIRYFRKIVIEATIPTVWFHLLMAADVVIALGIGCFMYKKYNTKFLYYV